ncbi:hypothetical protein [Bradyrhizobium sp. AZCC 1708]|uniref:hypothetical protein n=1 Tax=Bradyrhizobium sp. AZCC 1708 TaxID=3117015 RepID=UPI002FF071D3
MLQLVRGNDCHSFKSHEELGQWLLAQAGVRNLRVRRLGGMWALCEDLEEGYSVLARMSVDDSRPVQAQLLRLFAEQWAEALGFELAGMALQQRKRQPRLRRSNVRSYMISERAHISAFGY